MKRTRKISLMGILLILATIVLVSCGPSAPVDRTIYVSSAEELNAIRFTLKEQEYFHKFKMTKDISLSEYDSWEPIVSNSENNFDGGGFSITGLKIKNPEYGLLGLFSNYYGVIENLTLEVEIETGVGKNYIGSFAGKIEGYQTKIINCKSYGSIKVIDDGGSKSEFTDYVGGFVGYIDGATIENCENHITIDVCKGNYVGGFVGYAINFLSDEWDSVGNKFKIYEYKSGLVINSTNYSTITSEGDRVGGIIGYVKHTGNGNKIVSGDAVINSINLGDIIAPKGDFIGGIFGEAEFTNMSGVTFQILKNSGKVIGRYYVGGIFGKAESIVVKQDTLENSGEIEGINFISET